MMVQSLDGNITHGNNNIIYNWTSPEDSARFFAEVASHNLIIMGAKTYEAAREKIKLQSDKLRIVLTHRPDQYASEQKANVLEFTNASLPKLLQQLVKRGYTSALVVGGSQVNAAFFDHHAVDELWLTIEPVLLSNGQHLCDALKTPQQLQLTACEQLNAKGTIFLKYKTSSTTTLATSSL
jgi:dihydrofolate reductase